MIKKFLTSWFLLCSITTISAQIKFQLPDISLPYGEAAGYMINLNNLPISRYETGASSPSAKYLPNGFKCNVVYVYNSYSCATCLDSIEQLINVLKTDQPYTKPFYLWIVNEDVTDSKDRYLGPGIPAPEKPYRWQPVFDPDNELSKKLTFNNYPLVVFLDENNDIVYSHDEKTPLSTTQIWNISKWITENKMNAGERLYFDENWIPTLKQTAKYYREIEQNAGLYSMKDYYINGTLQMNGSYRIVYPSLRHGNFTYYNSNGSVSSKEKYFNNQLDGPFISYYENGKIAQQSEGAGYVRGKRQGVWKKYYDNGNLMASTTYKMGLLEYTKYFGKDGALELECYFTPDGVLDSKKKQLFNFKNEKNELFITQFKFDNWGNPNYNLNYNNGDRTEVKTIGNTIECKTYNNKNELLLWIVLNSATKQIIKLFTLEPSAINPDAKDEFYLEYNNNGDLLKGSLKYTSGNKKITLQELDGAAPSTIYYYHPQTNGQPLKMDYLEAKSKGYCNNFTCSLLFKYANYNKQEYLSTSQRFYNNFINAIVGFIEESVY